MLNKKMTLGLWGVVAIVAVFFASVPIFFSSPPDKFEKISSADGVDPEEALARFRQQTDYADIFLSRGWTRVLGDRYVINRIRDLPMTDVYPTIVRSGDVSNIDPKLPRQDLVVVSVLDSRSRSFSDGWIFDRLAKPYGEAVTSRDVKERATLRFRVTVEQAGSYDLMVRLRHDDARGTLTTRIDGRAAESYLPTSKKDPDGDLVEMVNIGTWDLSQGIHEIEFVNAAPFSGKGFQTISWLILKQTLPESSYADLKIATAPVDRWTTRMELPASSEPYILNVAKEYDSSWSLETPKGKKTSDGLWMGAGMFWVMDASTAKTVTLHKSPVVPGWGGVALALTFIVMARMVVYFFFEKRS